MTTTTTTLRDIALAALARVADGREPRRHAPSAAAHWVLRRYPALPVEYRYESAPTDADDMAVGVDVLADGIPVAAGLFSDGDLDVDSDGCFDLRPPEQQDWPDADEAYRAVWGEEEDDLDEDDGEDDEA